MIERESTLASVRRGKDRKAGRMEGATGNGAIWPFFLSKRMCGRGPREQQARVQATGVPFKESTGHC